MKYKHYFLCLFVGLVACQSNNVSKTEDEAPQIVEEAEIEEEEIEIVKHLSSKDSLALVALYYATDGEQWTHSWGGGC